MPPIEWRKTAAAIICAVTLVYGFIWVAGMLRDLDELKKSAGQGTQQTPNALAFIHPQSGQTVTISALELVKALSAMASTTAALQRDVDEIIKQFNAVTLELTQNGALRHYEAP